MIKTKNLLLGTFVIVVCAGSFFFLLANSSVPIFTVKELMDHPQTESYMNRNIQLIGVVQGINTTGFFIYDPDDVDNASLVIYINATNVVIPPGVESSRTILVEGKLISMSNIWRFKASMVSTKCPSKYQSD